MIQLDSVASFILGRDGRLDALLLLVEACLGCYLLSRQLVMAFLNLRGLLDGLLSGLELLLELLECQRVETDWGRLGPLLLLWGGLLVLLLDLLDELVDGSLYDRDDTGRQILDLLLELVQLLLLLGLVVLLVVLNGGADLDCGLLSAGKLLPVGRDAGVCLAEQGLKLGHTHGRVVDWGLVCAGTLGAAALAAAAVCGRGRLVTRRLKVAAGASLAGGLEVVLRVGLGLRLVIGLGLRLVICLGLRLVVSLGLRLVVGLGLGWDWHSRGWLDLEGSLLLLWGVLNVGLVKA